MTTEYRIAVVVSPDQAIANTKRMERALVDLDKTAAHTEQSVRRTLEQQVRAPRGLAGGRAGGALAGPDPRVASAYAEVTAAINEEIFALQREAQLIGLSADQRAIAERQMAAEAALRKAGVAVTVEQSAALRAQIAVKQSVAAANARANAELQREAAVLQQIRGPMIEYQADLRAVNALWLQGRISAAEYRQQVDRLGRELREAQRAQAGGGPGLGGALLAAGGTALAAGFAAGAVMRQSDQYTEIQNRIGAVTESSDELAAASERLRDIANDTGTAWKSVTEIYVRTSGATKDLGVSQARVLAFTERLTKAVKLSGATSEEANAAMIQLSQGLASGTLRGDELRSVLEQLPTVADVIAKGLGVTRGELRKLGEEGKITATDIISAFRKAGPEIDRAFDARTETFGDKLTVAKNKVVEFVGGLGDAVDELEEFGGSGGNLAVQALGSLSSALSSNARALELRKDANAEVVRGIEASIRAGSREVDELERLQRATSAAIPTVRIFGEVWDLYEERQENAERALVRFNRALVATQAGFRVGLAQFAAQTAKQALETTKEFEEAQKDAARAGEQLRDSLRGVVDQAFPAAAAARELAEIEQTLDRAVANGLITRKEATRALFQHAEAMREQISPYDAEIEKLQEEIQLLGLSADAREREIALMEFQRKIAAETGTVTADQVARYRELYDERERLQRAEELAVETSKRIAEAAEERARREQQAFDETARALQEQGESAAKAAQALRTSLNELDRPGTLGSGISSGVQEIATSLFDVASAAEGAVTNAFRSAESALVSLVTTGKADFKSLVDSMLADLARLLLRQGLLGLASEFFGFGSGGGSIVGPLGAGARIPGFADGGTYTVPGSGPPDSSLFMARVTPGERIDFTPPGRQSAASAPVVVPAPTVQVSNVVDPRAALSVLRSPAGRRVLKNVIQEEGPQIRALLRVR